MKLFIAAVLLLTFQLAHASEHEGTQKHHDWNEVFKQPVTDRELATAPEASQILEPAFLSKVKGSEVTLKWKSVEGAQYHLQVATDPNFKWLVVNEPLVSYTEYNLKNLQAGQQYFWRVYTQNPHKMTGSTKGPAVKSEFETVQ